MRYKFIYIVLFIVTNSIILVGQDEKINKFKNISLSSDIGYGFVMPHHKFIEYCVEDHIKSFDIRIAKQTIGEKPWHKGYRYPRYGLGYYRSNLSNDLVFGNVNAIYSFINIPFFEKKVFSLNYQISVGMAYISKIFDLENNYKNIAIGSHNNIYLDFRIQPKIQINHKIAVSGNLRFTHFSNGKIASPNKGLNLVNSSLGVHYSFANSKKITADTDLFLAKNKFTVIYSGAIKTITRYEKGHFFASSISGDYYRQYNENHQWGVGADIFFDSVIRAEQENSENTDIKDTDLFQYGIHIGHDMLMGKLAFCLQLGVYVYTPVEPEAPIYNRLGIRYFFANNIIANISLKSHYGKASFIEFGVGYCFN
ncbi:MAG: acyloxyacyl hydrolase [Bacteroidota bacterium]|nr:acyloxyacyl hydrolase [Bacteroidota bacterium]